MINIIKRQCQLLRQDFLGTWGIWQNGRNLWILIGLMGLSSELIAVYFFQNFLELEACEKCVYIRFSMLAIFVGAIIAAILPKNIFFKLSGYIIVIWSIIRGVIWSIQLELLMREAERLGSKFISSCSMFNLEFPFGLPMMNWFPSHFFPLALCGEDTWRFLGLNMAEYVLMLYAAFTVIICLMLLGWFKLVLIVKKHPSLDDSKSI